MKTPVLDATVENSLSPLAPEAAFHDGPAAKPLAAKTEAKIQASAPKPESNVPSASNAVPKAEGGDVTPAAKTEAQAEAAPEVLVVRRVEELEPFIAGWQELADSACESNVFYEPWMLLPALKAFGDARTMEFHLVFAPGRGPQSAQPLLNGFFPFQRGRRLKGLPARTLTLWKHMYCMVCTPLVRKGEECDTVGALLDSYQARTGGPEVLLWNYVSADRAFGQMLVDLFHRRQTFTHVEKSWNRALFRPHSKGDGGEYINDALSRKKRKEIKRKENRLAEVGKVEYEELTPNAVDNTAYDSAPADAWITHFLALESSGWKGRKGSAFACDTTHREFFRAIASEGHRRRKLRMLALQVDGQPIALNCDFLTGNGAFAFKIAYNEEYARFSPGVLLEVENVQRLHRNKALRWMDSCAMPDHSMINHICRERRTLQNLFIATGVGRGEFVLAFLPMLRCLSRSLRRALKRPASTS